MTLQVVRGRRWIREWIDDFRKTQQFGGRGFARPIFREEEAVKNIAWGDGVAVAVGILAGSVLAIADIPLWVCLILLLSCLAIAFAWDNVPALLARKRQEALKSKETGV